MGQLSAWSCARVIKKRSQVFFDIVILIKSIVVIGLAVGLVIYFIVIAVIG